MTALPIKDDTPYSEGDYLASERISLTKHHWIDGQRYAMSGASREHNLIVSSLIATLYPQLRGQGCELYPSDMKVRTPSTASYVYSDVVVTCGPPHFADEHADILLNPTLIIKVLSPHTERYDRGKTFQRYREIPSLQTYLLVAQDAPRLERFARQSGETWQFNEAEGISTTLDLPTIGAHLALAAVYEQIQFERDDSI